MKPPPIPEEISAPGFITNYHILCTIRPQKHRSSTPSKKRVQPIFLRPHLQQQHRYMFDHTLKQNEEKSKCCESPSSPCYPPPIFTKHNCCRSSDFADFYFPHFDRIHEHCHNQAHCPAHHIGYGSLQQTVLIHQTTRFYISWHLLQGLLISSSINVQITEIIQLWTSIIYNFIIIIIQTQRKMFAHQYPQSPQSLQSHKKMIFADEIRQKKRESLRKELRCEFEEEAALRDMFRELPESLDKLYNVCKLSKAGEYAVAKNMVMFVQSGLLHIKLDSIKAVLYWGYLLSLTFEYSPTEIEPILTKTANNLLHQCSQIKNYQLLYLTLPTAIKQLPKTNSQFLLPYLQATNSELLNSINCDIHTNITYDCLCYMRVICHRFPELFGEFVHGVYLGCLCLQVDRHIGCLKAIQEIVKILVVVTYHDGELYQNVTNVLLRGKIMLSNTEMVECQLTNRLKFILEFINIKCSHSLPQNITALIGNIIQNDAQAIEELMETGIHQLLFQLSNDHSPVTPEESSQKEQKTSQTTRKTKFTSQQRIQFGKTYLLCVGCLINQKKVLDDIRERDVVRKMLQVIENFGSQDEGILSAGRHSFWRLLEIGEEIMSFDVSKFNPYELKLYHLGGGEILNQFPEYFQDILRKYNI